MNTVVTDIVKRIRGATRILLISHVDPDGDAIGSLLGLGVALRRLGKETALACPSPTPAKFAFLPGWDEITSHPEGEFDLFISLDCSDPLRMGDIYTRLISGAATPLVNIDHHVTNVRFGAVNWVGVEAVATAEMVAELVDALEVDIDREIALPLLAGIVTDTRGFRTSNVNAHVLRTASRLLDTGITVAEVLERTLNVRSYSMICLWGKMLQTTHLDGRIAWATLTPQMQQECGSNGDSDGGFVNFLASALEADVGVVFHDRGNGGIEVGFRSKPGVNIAEVALGLGGGGHPQAAGCTVRGNMAEVQQRVLTVLKAAIADQRATFS
jgi:bifunctional oligoribonuclease and PAP phosphatase NrnA